MNPPWLEGVRRFLGRHVDPHDRLLVAASGGADSMALLGLLRLELKLEPDRVVAGHVRHGIRSEFEQDADQAEVARAANDYGFSVVVRSVGALDFAGQEHLSLEVAARRLRYRALGEMAEAEGCSWILTAHTMDDSAETVLMRMRSGAPGYEWTGIPPRRDRILRPLLSVRRAELRAWVGQHGLTFQEDATNRDLRFGRNQLRAWLATRPDYWTPSRISELAENGEGLRASLALLGRLAHVWARAHKAPSGIVRSGLAIDEIFRYFNNLTFIPVEAAWAEMCGLPQGRLPSARRRQVADLLRGTSPHAHIHLPHGITLVRAERSVWLSRSLQSDTFYLPFERGGCALPEWGGTLYVLDSSVSHSMNAVSLDRSVFERPLVVRTWRPGERMQVRGRPRKKIADLLAEQGVDPVQRRRMLVLADPDGPLWILGGAVAERALPRSPDDHVIWVDWKVHDATGAVHVF